MRRWTWHCPEGKLRCANVPTAKCGRSSGYLLLIGGAEDRGRGSALLHSFVELSGGACARIVVITTASESPSRSFAEYSTSFHGLGAPIVRELRLVSHEDAYDDRTLTELMWATGVFFSGGDQSRLSVLVGSRANQCLRNRLVDNRFVLAGTSAGATVMGTTMILGAGCRAVDNPMDNQVRTGPGLSLLPGVIVDMHLTERRRLPRLLAAVVRQPSHLGVGIDENTAILVSSGRFDVIGGGAVVAVDAHVKTANRPTFGQDEQPSFDVRLHRLHAGDSFDLHRKRAHIAGTIGDERNAN
ncbi:MAG TPA: cyanophycinase [Pseudonocardiaceae bacterium]|nr:cyanophycinase [Pseudonocardiaceae bacterium]